MTIAGRAIPLNMPDSTDKIEVPSTMTLNLDKNSELKDKNPGEAIKLSVSGLVESIRKDDEGQVIHIKVTRAEED